MTPKLDWRSHHDPRSRDYPVTATVAASVLRTAARASVLWTPGPPIDQGSEGACVGFAWTNEALASPVRVELPSDPDVFARQLYQQAQTLDDWPGEDYEGTSVLAGAKAVQAHGYLREYRWCFSVNDVILAIVQHGPVVLGIPWLEDMFTPDTDGELHATGAVAGGHAILANGYIPRLIRDRPMIHLQNSWGADWGRNGGGWISTEGLASLLANDGEACVPVRRSYGRLAK
jgi:hypothetical protein